MEDNYQALEQGRGRGKSPKVSPKKMVSPKKTKAASPINTPKSSKKRVQAPHTPKTRTPKKATVKNAGQIKAMLKKQANAYPSSDVSDDSDLSDND